MHQLRIGLRTLLKSPGFLFTAVFSLALAIGASAAAFSVIDAVRFRALPFANAERLVVLGEAATPGDGTPGRNCEGACTVSYLTYSTLLRDRPFRTLDYVVATTSGAKALTKDGDAVTVTGGVVSHDVFAMLGARPLLGRALLPGDDALGVPLVTVLGHDLWATQFGRDPRIIGQTVKFSDSKYVVVGVMPPGFDFESGSQFWLPAVPTLDPSTRPSITEVTVMARLRPGVTLEQLRAELATIEPVVPVRSGSGLSGKARLVADPLRARYASSTQSHDLAFAAIVACVLLIACANLANLILVRTMHQQREFSIRTALGAGRSRLLQPVLVQNGIIVGVSLALGLAMASATLGVLRSLPVLTSLRPTGMDYRIDWRVVAFVLLIALIAAAVISLVPARLAARHDLQSLLRGTSPAANRRGRGWAHQGFVVSQIACATVLLSGAVLMTQSVVNASRVELGFDDAHVVTASPSFPHSWRQPAVYMPAIERILDALQGLPAVTSVSARAAAPLAARNGSAQVTPEGHTAPLATSQVPGNALSVSPGYFATMGVRVVAGRDFGAADRDSRVAVAIINQWAARHWWPNQNAIGRSIRIETGAAPAATLATAPPSSVTLTVVGVVADNKAARPNLLLALDGPELYRPYRQAMSAFPTFYVRASSRPEALLKPTREVMVRLVPDRPVFSNLVRQRVEQQLSGVRTNTMQIAAFAIVGLVLALIGVYGVLSFEVNRRTREIGIRSALGASRMRSAQSVLTSAAVLTALGVCIGVPVAMAASRLISSLLFRTDGSDPLVYAWVVLGVLLVSLLAAWGPARRATRVDPIIALRTE